MKRVVAPIIFLICICVLLCGCDNGYEDLEVELDSCKDEINYLEDELLQAESCLGVVLNYIKKPNTTEAVENLDFNQTWSLKDYFDFSFYYDKELKSLCYNIEDKNGVPIRLIFEDTPQIQELLIAVYSSNGELETYYGIGDSETLFFVPEYDYTYDVLLFATVDDNIYRANYNFSVDDIK